MDQKKIFLAVKLLLVVFLIGYLGFLLKDETVANMDMKDIEKGMASEESLSALKKHGDKSLMRYYGLTGSDYDGYVFFKAASPMAVDELLIIKAKNPDQISKIESAVNSRLNSQKTNFEGYGAEQTALLSDYILQTKGNYLFFAVSDNAEKWQKTFNEMIEE